MDPDTRLPDPPEEYDEQQRKAWRAGGAAMLQLLGGFSMQAASALEAANQTDDSENGDTCQICGDGKIDAMGGSACPTCDV